MKIFLDFDDTIFDRGAFWKKMESVFLEKGVSSKIISESYEKSRKKISKDFSVFNPEKQIRLISKEVPIDRKILESGACGLFRQAGKYVYPDFWEFIKGFKRSELYIISFGDDKFQRNKIKHAGIEKKFKEVIVTQKKKSKEIKKIIGKDPKEMVIFIDDRIDQFEGVRKMNPSVHCFQIDRKSKGSGSRTKNGYYRVRSLLDISKIINNKSLK